MHAEVFAPLGITDIAARADFSGGNQLNATVHAQASRIGVIDVSAHTTLVPRDGVLSVKLIDYDGMWVPALARARSGEKGHADFQHPQRLHEATWSPAVDRFPHLVIYTALRAHLQRAAPLPVDAGDARETQRVIEAARRSAAAGGARVAP